MGHIHLWGEWVNLQVVDGEVSRIRSCLQKGCGEQQTETLGTRSHYCDVDHREDD